MDYKWRKCKNLFKPLIKKNKKNAITWVSQKIVKVKASSCKTEI